MYKPLKPITCAIFALLLLFGLGIAVSELTRDHTHSQQRPKASVHALSHKQHAASAHKDP